MKLRVQCPTCKWIGSVDKKLQGKKGKCPKCGANFILAEHHEGTNTDDDPTVEAKIEFVDGKITVTRAEE